MHRVTGDADFTGHGQRFGDLGVLVDILEPVNAVGNGGDPGAHLPFGVVLQRVGGGEHDIPAIFAAQRLHAQHAEAVRGHLRAQVRQPFARNLAVQQDQLLHILLQLPGPVQPDRRDPQPLLENMGVAAVGKIGVVGGVDRPGDNLAVDEDRFGEDEIGKMGAAALVGIVADENVAGPDVLDRVALEDMRQHVDETAEVHRDVLSLAERVACGIEQCRRAVAAFLDVGGIAGSHQRLAHFLGDGRQRRPDDLDGDRIDRDVVGLQGGAHAPNSRIRFR